MAARPDTDDPEVLRLARELIADPDAPPVTKDLLTQSAVAQVAAELDDFDKRLFDRVRSQPADSSSRTGVEAAVAFRIHSARARLRVAVSEIGAAGSETG